MGALRSGWGGGEETRARPPALASEALKTPLLSLTMKIVHHRFL